MPESRRQYIAGNWKMYKTSAEARDYVQRLLSRLPMGNGVELALCAPFTALAATVDALGGSDVQVLAQNMHQEPEGAYTGEVSAPMLAELGVRGVLLGHSERRQYFNETDRALQEKVPAALEAGLAADAVRRRDRRTSTRRGTPSASSAIRCRRRSRRCRTERLRDVVIAYEPIWAIGTGKVATPENAQEAIGFIRALVGDRSRGRRRSACACSTAAASSRTTRARSSRSRTSTARSWAARRWTRTGSSRS